MWRRTLRMKASEKKSWFLLNGSDLSTDASEMPAGDQQEMRRPGAHTLGFTQGRRSRGFRVDVLALPITHPDRTNCDHMISNSANCAAKRMVSFLQRQRAWIQLKKSSM